jgi:hypothetical protein
VGAHADPAGHRGGGRRLRLPRSPVPPPPPRGRPARARRGERRVDPGAGTARGSDADLLGRRGGALLGPTTSWSSRRGPGSRPAGPGGDTSLRLPASAADPRPRGPTPALPRPAAVGQRRRGGDVPPRALRAPPRAGHPVGGARIRGGPRRESSPPDPGCRRRAAARGAGPRSRSGGGERDRVVERRGPGMDGDGPSGAPSHPPSHLLLAERRLRADDPGRRGGGAPGRPVRQGERLGDAGPAPRRSSRP